MRTRFFLSTIILLNFCWGFAQTGKNTDYLDLTVGPSFPLGNFARKDITNSSSGFAKAGEVLKISYTHLVKKGFGFSITLHGQRNPLNTEALETSFAQVNFYEDVFAGPTANQNPTQYSYRRYDDWKFEKKSWLFGSFLLGGYGQISPRQSKRLLVTAKAMLGILYVHAPEISGKSISDTAMAQIKQNSSSALGFAYSIVGGLKLKFTDRFYFLTQAEYLGTNKILFKAVESTFTSAHYSNGFPTSASMQLTTANGKQQIASINLSVGIGVGL